MNKNTHQKALILIMHLLFPVLLSGRTVVVPWTQTDFKENHVESSKMLRASKISEFTSKCHKGSDFPHKQGGVGKIGGCFKKGGVTYFQTN